MARAAVLPPSPAKRAARTAPRAGLTKTNAASSKAKTAAAKKSSNKATTATTRTAAVSDSDDTDDELGMMMEYHAPKPARSRGRPPGRPATKATTTSRGKKTAPAPAAEESHGEREDTAKPEPPKKRVGRPRKNPVPEESPAKTEAEPKPRGRPKGSGTTKTTATARKGTQKAAGAEAATDSDEHKHFMIATNSTTMRSNILRGPAKKKTVTFQDVSDSEAEDAEEPAATAAGRRKASAKGTGAGAAKTGLGATPVRKNATTGGRGRKPAAAKKAASQPLSPKKDKQMTKSLSAYASSDGEEDELSAAKDDFKSPVKLVVHSPVKHTSEDMGLSSPVRKINFTPKKASSLIDENGDPKLPTPKHGSAATGLSSPVRKINFTPNRSYNTVADNGHLALPPGKSIDFSDSVFMSSPARRPEASPFQFNLKDTPNRGLANSIPAPNFTPGQSSPLKASPKKGHLGASFSGSPSKSTPSFPARSSLFQSPAKRPASPFKGSLFASKDSNEGEVQSQDGVDLTSHCRVSPPKLSSPQDKAIDEDIEMVEEVARDIFGIELYSDSKASSESPLSRESLEAQAIPEAEPAGAAESDAADIDEKLEELEEEIRREPDDMGTICFSTMEELQEPFQNLERRGDLDEDMQMDELNSVHGAAVDEKAPEPEMALDSAELMAASEQVNMAAQDPHAPTVLSSPSEPTLGLTALEEAQSPASFHEVQEDNVEEEVEHVGSIRQPFDEQEAESEEDDMHDDEPTLLQSEATFAITSQSHSPYGVSEAEDTSPLQASHSVPPPVPTPPVREMASAAKMTPKSARRPDSAKSINRLFDIKYEPRVDVEEDSLFETTQSEIPTPTAPSASNTPAFRHQRKSIGVDLGFTPLAEQFGGWETNTPSQGRPARPRRRGVFSLVGPLEKSESITHDAGDVSYPDLSHASLANTPRLFAELPPQPQSDRASMTPEAVLTTSPMVGRDHEMVDSPAKSEIFEDPEPTTPEAEESARVLSHDAFTPDMAKDQEEDLPSDDEKENSDTPSFVPPTTPVRAVSEHRTVHTVSKVPLKGEGEVSPLKLPRKRGFSLSSTSPTRSSPRSRKSPFRAGSAPSFSPHKAPRRERSPSPNRRCSTSRRSSGKLPAMAPPKSPSVAASPAKTARRTPSQQALRGAVVHVDVHTTEGEDASGIFVELLQQMGARCVKSWPWNPHSSLSPVEGQDPNETNAKVGITHVVYKDGGLRTLEKVKQAAGLVKCVGVGWVLE